MQNITENLGKICQTVSKPMIEMTELNVNTLNNLTKNTNSFEKLAQAKKPDDYLAAQMELINAASQEFTRYTQKACNIGLEAVTNANKIWTDMFHETSAKASDMIKATGMNKNKDRDNRERE